MSEESEKQQKQRMTDRTTFLLQKKKNTVSREQQLAFRLQECLYEGSAQWLHVMG